MINSYEPIECGLHSEYELAIMKQIKSVLIWKDTNNSSQSATVLPTDLIVKNKEEFLTVKTNTNEELVIRLDKIISLKPAQY